MWPVGGSSVSEEEEEQKVEGEREEGGGGGALPGCVACRCGGNRTKLLINTLSRCNLVKLLPVGLGGSTIRFVSVAYSGASFKSGSPRGSPISCVPPWLSLFLIVWKEFAASLNCCHSGAWGWTVTGTRNSWEGTGPSWWRSSVRTPG